MTRGIFIAVIVAIAWGLGSAPPELRGCAPAPRSGERVGIKDETALIIWDDARNVEHFIRRATFAGTARDFGFLVPTPNRPRVEPADSDIFKELSRVTEPKVEHRSETSLRFGCAGNPQAGGDRSTPVPASSGVIVLEQKRVGNLDAAVLAFRADKTRKVEDTADELLSWLTTRGYAVRTDLTEWLAPYIDKNWVITAFKIAGEPGGDSAPAGAQVVVKASPVRLSFETEKPFFPYREPAAQREPPSGAVPRTLRVYVAATQRMAGTIGDSAPWPAETVWANHIADSDRAGLLGRLKLPAETAFGKWWITEFEDDSSSRPGTDEVYFERSMDRGPVARAPTILVTYKNPWWAGPLAIILVLAVCGGGLVLVRRYAGTAEENAQPDRPPPLPGKPDTKTSDGLPKADPRRWS
jgi:hypothetical protein